MELSKDFLTKAKWVADLMAADGLTADQVTPEFVFAYMDAIERKITAIQSTYLTRTGAAAAMQSVVFQLI